MGNGDGTFRRRWPHHSFCNQRYWELRSHCCRRSEWRCKPDRLAARPPAMTGVNLTTDRTNVLPVCLSLLQDDRLSEIWALVIEWQRLQTAGLPPAPRSAYLPCIQRRHHLFPWSVRAISSPLLGSPEIQRIPVDHYLVVYRHRESRRNRSRVGTHRSGGSTYHIDNTSHIFVVRGC